MSRQFFRILARKEQKPDLGREEIKIDLKVFLCGLGWVVLPDSSTDHQFIRECVCVRVCVCERERERLRVKSQCVFVCVRECKDGQREIGGIGGGK